MLAAVPACESTREPSQGVRSVPTPPGPATALGVVVRNGYIDAHIGPQPGLRFFFPSDETCRGILYEEARVIYVRRGSLGRVEGPDGTMCSAVGIASLREWRDRGPRPRIDRPLPRSPVSFRVVYRDDDLVFARGRFPLASQVGWARGEDTIALLPTGEACKASIESGVGSMEFRSSGRVPFQIVSGGQNCPIVGFVLPLPDPR